MNSKLNKIVILIFGIFILLIGSRNVYAGLSSGSTSLIKIDDLFTGLQNASFYSIWHDNNYDVSFELDKDNNKLDIYLNNKKEVTLSYTDNYLEYDNSSVELNYENAAADLKKSFLIYYVFGTLSELSNISNKYLDINNDLSNTYDQYGIQMQTEEFSFKKNNNNSSETFEGDFIRHLKISLNKEKIVLMHNQFGTSDATVKNYNDFFSISFMFIDDDFNFESVTVNDDTTIFANEDEDSMAFSNDGEQEDLDNPETGAFLPIGMIIVMIIGSVVLSICLKKKSLFNKI